MDDAHEDEPGAELAAADQRPAPADSVTTLDDHRPSTGAGAVRENRIRIGKDCEGNLLRPPDRRPVRVPIPHAPRDRGVRARGLLEDLRRRNRGEVESGAWR